MENVRRRVMLFCDVDSKRALGVPPGKLSDDRVWRLCYLLRSSDGIIYNLESKSLHCFRIPGMHIVRRPIECNWVDRQLWVFNEGRNEYTIELTSASGEYMFFPNQSDPFYTELNVLLKGEGIIPCLTRMNSTF
jgi:hypothetical protein